MELSIAKTGKSIRFKTWAALLYGLWGLAVIWLLCLLIYDLNGLSSLSEQTRTFRQFNGSGLGITPRAPLMANLFFTLWALVGAFGVAAMRINPFHWVGGRRIIWGSLSLALLLGRPLVGWLGSFFAPDMPSGFMFFFVPILMLLGGGLVIFLAFLALSAGFSFFIGVPVLLFSQILQFDQALHIYRQKKAGLVGYIVRLGYWLTGETMPSTPDDDKGARFASSEEIRALYSPGGDTFGHIGPTPLRLANEKHSLIMASTRSGKGVSLIIPHLLRYPGSAFVLDPKGENARATGRHRAELNGKVHYLDPFGISGKPKSRFNPLSRFTPENMEAESKALAAALIMGEWGKRDHWTASAQQLLAAIILFVFASPDFRATEKDLPTVRRVLLGSADTVLKAMAQSDLAGGLIADLASSFLKTPKEELGSIISTAQRETEILDNPFIISCLSASGEGEEVDFAAWHKGTMTVYLCLSAPKFPVFNRWLRLVLTAALDEMTDKLNPPPRPVCFMLDELATLGHLAAVENAIGLAAGYGVQLVAVFQDVAQMKDLYKSRWASFIGNAGVRAVFNLDDYDTAQYWSKFMGGHIVETTSQAQDIYGITQGQTKGEAVRPLLSPEEIMLQFAQGQMLVLPQGARPIKARRVAYFKDKTLEGLWDDPRQPSAA